MAKIGIDARFYGQIGKGLGRYTQKLIEYLEEIDDHNEYVIFLRKENFNHFIPKNKRFKKVLADYDWYSIREQLFFPFILYFHNLDMMHFPHFNVPIFYWKKIVVTIHDLILLHFPTVRATTLNPLWYWIKFIAYKAVIALAIHRAQVIITISNFTKNDIIAHYPKAKDKIQVTYEACETHCFWTRKNDDKILQKYGILKPYVLYVGNAYPHKNLERLVDAFSSDDLRKDNLHLVLVGKMDYFYEQLKRTVDERHVKNIVLTGYVSDTDLDVVYKNAEVYVFPSLYEGFGLPPLEAMSKGIPVIASDHECLREILEDSAFFIDATNSEFIANAISRLRYDANEREAYIRKGFAQIQKYSWRRMAQETLKLYENKQK